MDRDDVDPRRALLDKLTEPVSPVDALAFLSDLVRRAEAAPEPGSAPTAPSEGTPPAAAPAGGDARPNRGNYLGDGLYDFQGHPTRKMTAYVGPDVHRAVKRAAALRETTMSEIVDAVLRAAGFGDPDGPTAAQGRTR